MTAFVFVVSGSLLLLLLLLSTEVVVVVVVVIVILPSFSASPSRRYSFYELLKVPLLLFFPTLVKSDERYIIALEVRFWYLVSVYKHY